MNSQVQSVTGGQILEVLYLTEEEVMIGEKDDDGGFVNWNNQIDGCPEMENGEKYGLTCKYYWTNVSYL